MDPIIPLYIGRSTNAKTGDIPQQYIGATVEQARSSCHGCPLLLPTTRRPHGSTFRQRVFGFGCYAWRGYVAQGFRHMARAFARGKDYSLTTALANTLRSARYIRFGALGDPSAVDPDVLLAHEQHVRAAGLGILSYTHFWHSRGAHLKGRALASCETWLEAELAVSLGWRVALHVESLGKSQGRTEQGSTYLLCLWEGTHPRQCNACGLCDATRKGPDIIVFLDR